MGLTAAGWCDQRDRRWSSYGEESQASPWPQSLVLIRPELGLLICIRGGGGGAQQATFRNTLEQYLGRAISRWEAEPAAPFEGRLARLNALVQHEFESGTEPFFADHFEARWVAVLTDGHACVVNSHGSQRAWVSSGGTLRQVSRDWTLWSELQAGDPAQAMPWHQALELSRFGFFKGEPGNHQGHTTAFELGPEDVLLLISRLPHQLSEAALGALLAETLAMPDLEARAQLLYEAVARELAVLEKRDRGEHLQARWACHGAIVLARVDAKQRLTSPAR